MLGHPNTQPVSFSFKEQVEIRSNTIPVLVEFSFPGCGPCKWMENTLIELTKRMEGRVEFVSIAVSDHPELVTKYNITSNPTTFLFKDGLPVSKISGALPIMALEQWVKDHI